MPPTLRQIAAAAGVSVATASYALRSHPKISPATRARVEAAAERLGHRVDPLLAAYMSARRTGKDRRWSPVLAYLTDFPERDEWAISPWATRVLEGAERTATRRGYRVETLWIPDLGPTPARAAAVLRARGIDGLFISPFPEGKRTLDFPWQHFAFLALDCSLDGVQHHGVYHDTAHGVLTVLDRAELAGFRRVGIAMRSSDDLRSESGWLGGYLAWHHRRGLEAPPPLLYPTLRRDPELLAGWTRRERPDCVVTLRDDFVPEVLAACRRRGAPPIAFAALNLQDPEPLWAGVRIDGRAAGDRAADLLIHLLETGERGEPGTPVRLLVRPRWSPGASFPG